MSDLTNFLKSAFSNIPVDLTLQTMKEIASDEATEMSAVQQSSKDSYLQSTEEMTNPFIRNDKHKLIENRSPKAQKLMHTATARAIDPVARMKEMAEQFQRRNQELKATTLIRIREMLKAGVTKDEVLKIVQDFYPDVSLADEVLEFLLEETETDKELQATIKEAREDLHSRHERDIVAGRNIGNVARQASEKGLGTPSNLRDMYRDITNNPRDSLTLFQELAQKYAFKDLNKVISFLLHSLGADLKSKGPSIAPGQLHRLFTETRSLQAILGVYRFFRGRMGLMQGMFSKEQESLPPSLNFENMAKQFIALAGDRYPSGDKVFQTGVRLGIEKWLLAKIIAFSQFRDAVKEVAVYQIYSSIQHRDELYNAILDALEHLEEQWEEEHERDEDEDEDEGRESSEDKEKKKK